MADEQESDINQITMSYWDIDLKLLELNIEKPNQIIIKEQDLNVSE